MSNTQKKLVVALVGLGLMVVVCSVVRHRQELLAVYAIIKLEFKDEAFEGIGNESYWVEALRTYIRRPKGRIRVLEGFLAGVEKRKITFTKELGYQGVIGLVRSTHGEEHIDIWYDITWPNGYREVGGWVSKHKIGFWEVFDLVLDEMAGVKCELTVPFRCSAEVVPLMAVMDEYSIDDSMKIELDLNAGSDNGKSSRYVIRLRV
mgnify:CR=1 FL=1